MGQARGVSLPAAGGWRMELRPSVNSPKIFPRRGPRAQIRGCSHCVSFAMGTLAFTSLCGFSQGHFNMRDQTLCGLSPEAYQGISFSASAQPLTEELVDDETIDLPNSGNSIRRRFLLFYASRGHKVLPSASLVPDDPTVLLTITGMLQYKPIFLGQVPRQVPRATSAQRCIRTNDVENVGRTARHHTFFEMLGNFSFGDYFMKEAIMWAWELSTTEFSLPVDKLWVSVYEDDDEAFVIWRDEVGVPVERIKRMGAEDNFWLSGVTGPCGPCSEIYYDFHPERGCSDADLGDDTRFIEFYNLVFVQYNRTEDGSLEPLKQKNMILFLD